MVNLLSLFGDILNMLLFLISNIHFVILAIIGLNVLVVIHEFGHLIFAKIFNIYVPSFSVGFGPIIYQKKIGETTYAISAIPLGGYVEVAGAPEVGQGEQKHAKDTGEYSFESKAYWKKMAVISGGILFNLVSAYFLLVLLALIGIPCLGDWCKNEPAKIGHLTPNSSTLKSGLKPGDFITAINKVGISNIEDYTKQIQNLGGKRATFEVKRNGSKQIFDVDIEGQKVNDKILPKTGIYFYTSPVSLKESFKVAWNIVCSISGNIFSALGRLFKGKSEGLGGPILLITQISQGIKLGFRFLLLMLAFISINLAIFNIIPLPIFDGGQALFYTIEAIKGKSLSNSTREKIHKFTWMLILILMVYLVAKDLIFSFKLFKS